MPELSPQNTNLAIALLTPPLLLGILASQWVLSGLSELGEASEEIFRAERLPVLNFPTHSTTENV